MDRKVIELELTRCSNDVHDLPQEDHELNPFDVGMTIGKLIALQWVLNQGSWDSLYKRYKKIRDICLSVHKMETELSHKRSQLCQDKKSDPTENR